MRIDKPKDKLKSATNHRYDESHAAALLDKADHGKLRQACRYFRDFDDAFRQRLKLP